MNVNVQICSVGYVAAATESPSLKSMSAVTASAWTHARATLLATGSLTMMLMALASCLRAVMTSALIIVTLVGQVNDSVNIDQVVNNTFSIFTSATPSRKKNILLVC